jgi:iron complex transport system permease protein
MGMPESKTGKANGFRDKAQWKVLMLFVFAFFACAGFFVSNSIGTMEISIPDILNAIFVKKEGAIRQVIWNIRLPRTIVAGLVGTNLAVSGAILQGVMQNPLADPHIIGISSGAGLAGIIILILFPHLTYLVPPVAFIGAMGAAIMIYALAWKGGIQPLRVILSGVAVSSFLSACISGLMVFYSDRVSGALMFMAGGLSARSWPHVKMILPYTVFGCIASFIMSEKLNILVLGDDTAKGLGLNVEADRLLLTAIGAVLAASAVCVVGLLGFVGLIVPHMVRLLIGSDHKFLLPGSALLGAGLVMLSDTLARTLFSPQEIPVGIITAALGAPFFLFLLRRER